MRMGPVYPALPENCPVTFINNQHIDILASGYEQLGMIAIAGTTDQMAAAEAKIPDAVAAAACKLGGTSISLANQLATSGSGVLQFSIWRAPKTAESSRPSGPTTQGI